MDSQDSRTLQPPGPRRATLQPVSETVVMDTQVRQRKMMKRFCMGDVVEVYSGKRQKWFLDGQVTESVDETCVMDGSKVRAGSVKVIYDHGMTFKWVPPQQWEECLRPSPRPKPPEVIATMVVKEGSSWLVRSEKQVFAEMNQGFFQWWESPVDAEECQDPEYSMYLLGLQVSRLSNILKLQTGSDQISLKMADENEAALWERALAKHATYTAEVRRFYENKMARRSSSFQTEGDLASAIVKKEMVSVQERRQAKERFARKGTVASFNTMQASGDWAVSSDRLSPRNRSISNVSADMQRRGSRTSRNSVFSNSSDVPQQADQSEKLSGARLSFGRSSPEDARRGGS